MRVQLRKMSVPAEWRWIIAFSVVDFANRIFFGAYGTLMGPLQPYIAKSTNVDIETISWLWTFGGVAWLLGTLLSAFTFKRFLTSSTSKLSFFTFTSFVMAVTSFRLPTSVSFIELAAMFSIRQFVAAAWETAGAGILVFCMGPVKSRVLVMCHHFVAGFGFWVGPLLFKHYLPSNDPNEDLCKKSVILAEGVKVKAIDEGISYPFHLVSYGHVLCCFGYVAVMIMPFYMPEYQNETEHTKNSPTKNKNLAQDNKEVLAMAAVITFYVASCGSERLFQTLEFIFGMCGPLKLSAVDAVFTDQMYNGGFMVGRFISMFVVDRLSPRTLLKYSTLGCLTAASLAAFKAGEVSLCLYASAGIFGFCVSVQFGSAFSWTAEHMDVVGSRAAIFQVGCVLGSSVMATFAVYLFEHVHVMSGWYLSFICAILQVSMFFVLNGLFTQQQFKESEVKYKPLSTSDD